MENYQSQRYSEADLTEFKAVIDRKLAKAERQLATLDAQLQENNDNQGSHSDWADDSSSSTNLQMLDTMANRLRKHIIDLKNALLRIHSKSYGICSISGVLIDKKRLLAVPTTTKSVAVKINTSTKKRRTVPLQQPPFSKPKIPTIISKVVRKKETTPQPSTNVRQDDQWAKADDLLKNVEQLDLSEEMED
ncbi:MAG: hypothetical protein AAF960_09425 [Bacteroidota bacterium]